MNKTMLLKDFLLKKTKAQTLCSITENGYIISTVYIDYEDLFMRYMNPELLKKEVKEIKWISLTIADSGGYLHLIPCLSIEIGESNDFKR